MEALDGVDNFRASEARRQPRSLYFEYYVGYSGNCHITTMQKGQQHFSLTAKHVKMSSPGQMGRAIVNQT